MNVELPDAVIEAIAQRAAEIVREDLSRSTAPDEWLDSKQAADYLGISVGHLHNLRGQVPSHKPNGRRRYRRSELDDYQEGSRR